jgi:hypothetical protein
VVQQFRRDARETSEVFRTQQRPHEIDSHDGGGDASEDEIQHGLDLSAKCDETDQRDEFHCGVDNRDDVAHREPSFLRQSVL